MVYYEYRLLDLGCYLEIYFNYYKKIFDCTSNDVFLLPQGNREQRLAEAQHSESKYKMNYYGEIQFKHSIQFAENDSKITALSLELLNLKSDRYTEDFKNIALRAREFMLTSEISFPDYNETTREQLLGMSLTPEIVRITNELKTRFKDDIYHKLEVASKKF